jgi:nicotinamide riboside kinase
MPAVFVIGAGGVGKTTLINRYITECGSKAVLVKELARTFMNENNISQADLENESVLWNLQAGIVKGQMGRENELDGQDFISDRSVVDALVYAAMIKPHRFPQLTRDNDSFRNDSAERLLSPLTGDSEAARKNVRRMVLRYRRSLVVLVYPFNHCIVDDGVRLVMNEHELFRYTELCGRILRILGVPFFDLHEAELPMRVELLKKASRDFRLPSPLSRLEHFENISGKKVDREAIARQFQDFNFPFYRVLRRKEDDKGSFIPCISVSNSEIHQSFVAQEPGKTSRFLELNDKDRLFLLEFSSDIPSSDVYNVLVSGVRIQGEKYYFLGCSSSGLKKRKCYLWRGSVLDADAVRQLNGDFSSIKTVSKQIARFSLLLTSVVPTSVQPINIVERPDVMSDSGGNFTDGCGCISSDIAADLFRAAQPLLARKTEPFDHTPRVFQIRYQGYKGVVVADSRLDRSTMVVRPSMKKFQTERFPWIGGM